MNPHKLKLGILLDSFDVPAWVEDAIQRVINGNAGEFVLAILNGAPDKSNKYDGSTIVYSIFNQIDERLSTKEPNPFAKINVAGLFSNIPVIKAIQTGKNGDWLLNESDIQEIKKYQLDILIKFGFEGLQIETLNLAKYGVWFYHHGDDRVMRAGPPGFWEVVENWPETSSALLAAGGKFSPNRVLFRSHFVTYPLSPARQRSYYFWATTTFLSRQINLLQQLGEAEYCRETDKFNAAPLPEVKRYEAPSNFPAAKAIVKIIVRLIREFLQRILYMKQWFLLFSFNKDEAVNFHTFRKIAPPKGFFWADPHAVQLRGKYYIFIEEFSQVKNKGYISVIELDEEGNWKAPVKILEKDYHLSYPFIFKWNDKFYMVPESRANKTIDLYECVDFPYQWNFKQCLMENISAVDSTLIHYSNKWWLFTAMAENEAAAPNVELFLFYADDLFSGKWTAHPKNPIVSDVKSARSAGSLFVKDGKLFRPSQDCSKGYGHGIDLNEVEVINEAEYRERNTLSIRPDWDKNIEA
ncbi:MAG: hypothetical protein HY863_16485, partial [Chloroflexi bacterium]|nr:hypothetical protein [Chloroflexota bacterium]